MYCQPKRDDRDPGIMWGVNRFIGLLLMYPVGWLFVAIVRVYRDDGWQWFYVKYLLNGEIFIFLGFILLNIYAVSRYGWRKFIRLIRDTR